MKPRQYQENKLEVERDSLSDMLQEEFHIHAIALMTTERCAFCTPLKDRWASPTGLNTQFRELCIAPGAKDVQLEKAYGAPLLDVRLTVIAVATPQYEQREPRGETHGLGSNRPCRNPNQ